MENAAIWESIVINSFTGAAITCWSNSISNPHYVLYWAGVIFDSEQVDCTNVERAGQARNE
jgi:hypothetical protein